MFATWLHHTVTHTAEICKKGIIKSQFHSPLTLSRFSSVFSFFSCPHCHLSLPIFSSLLCWLLSLLVFLLLSRSCLVLCIFLLLLLPSPFPLALASYPLLMTSSSYSAPFLLFLLALPQILPLISFCFFFSLFPQLLFVTPSTPIPLTLRLTSIRPLVLSSFLLPLLFGAWLSIVHSILVNLMPEPRTAFVNLRPSSRRHNASYIYFNWLQFTADANSACPRLSPTRNDQATHARAGSTGGLMPDGRSAPFPSFPLHSCPNVLLLNPPLNVRIQRSGEQDAKRSISKDQSSRHSCAF